MILLSGDSLITYIHLELCLFRYLAQSTYFRDTLYNKCALYRSNLVLCRSCMYYPFSLKSYFYKKNHQNSRLSRVLFSISSHFKMRDQRFWLIFSNIWIESRLSVVVIWPYSRVETKYFLLCVVQLLLVLCFSLFVESWVRAFIVD